ncbi:MAG TPA: hypothetical protein VJP85_03610 [Candidatus Baltobacteraceae bacterium]|nr:hypothetical protein [Candidatus Baltobacteraceae bacterium]
MIPALACLLLPFAGDCTALVRDVPQIAQLVRHREEYTGKEVSVTGRVRGLDQWISSDGLAQQIFFLCEGSCVRVYMPAHSAIREGELVTVQGTYFRAFRTSRAVYYNEVEGTEVLPRD